MYLAGVKVGSKRFSRRSIVRTCVWPMSAMRATIPAPIKCLFKINFILIANSLDDPFNVLNQGCKIRVGPKLNPFILHEAPKDFNQVQFRGIFRKIENEYSLFFPDRNRALEGFTRMD